MHDRLKPLMVTLTLLCLWHGLVQFFEVPNYILPSPVDVMNSLIADHEVLWLHAQVTLQEMLLGLLFGVSFGVGLALLLVYFAALRPWLLPPLLVTQSIPVFALAPLLMLWFGYGLTSKVVMTVLMIFFPVATCCYDGLRHTNKGWLALAKTMNANPLALLMVIRWPAALPAFASGLRVAVVVAPIGAVAGEWVGSSAGLGYLMMQSSARLWVDQMFAALAVLAVCSVLLYYSTDFLLRKLIPWQPVTH